MGGNFIVTVYFRDGSIEKFHDVASVEIDKFGKAYDVVSHIHKTVHSIPVDVVKMLTCTEND